MRFLDSGESGYQFLAESLESIPGKVWVVKWKGFWIGDDRQRDRVTLPSRRICRHSPAFSRCGLLGSKLWFIGTDSKDIPLA